MINISAFRRIEASPLACHMHHGRRYDNNSFWLGYMITSKYTITVYSVTTLSSEVSRHLPVSRWRWRSSIVVSSIESISLFVLNVNPEVLTVHDRNRGGHSNHDDHHNDDHQIACRHLGGQISM